MRDYDILPLSLRTETRGGVANPVVLRGTPLPAVRSESFTTASDDQTSVEIPLFVGESPLTRGNRPLGSLKLKDLPTAPRGRHNIMVQFSVGRDITVRASAVVEGTDIRAERLFRPPDGFDEDSISQVLIAADESRDADEEELQLIEARNRADDLIEQAEGKPREAPNKVLSEAVANLGLAIAAGESEAIRARSDALESVVKPQSDPFGAFNKNDLFSALFAAPKPAAAPATRQAKHAKTTPAHTSQKISSASKAPALGKIFGGGEFMLDTQLCFVLMPFAQELQPVYEGPIRAAIGSAGLRCERADEIHGVQMITWDIWERINRARVLVAELTDRNANVFYELGVAHALSKDVLLITQSMDFVPFDLKAVRCIVYEPSTDGYAELERKLAATLELLVKSQ